MTDTAQILLVAVVTILTILLIVIGIQVIYILREFRKSMEKVNKILDDAGIASGSVASSISSLNGVIAGLKTVLSLLGIFHKEKERSNE